MLVLPYISHIFSILYLNYMFTLADNSFSN